MMSLKHYIIPKIKEEHKKNLFDLIKISDLILKSIQKYEMQDVKKLKKN